MKSVGPIEDDLLKRAAGHVSPEGGFRGQPCDKPDYGPAADRRRGGSVEVVVSVCSKTYDLVHG
jgi:hypothetical protein